MFKKVLSFMLALAMCAALVVVPASAADATEKILFEENFDDASTAIAKFEQYGPNDSAATFSVKENYWGTSSNVLKFDTDGSPQNFTENVARAAIKGQKFGDVRIEFDYTVGPNSKSYIMFRMDDEYNGVAMQVGASSSKPYMLQHGAYKINAGVPDTSGLFFTETNNADGMLWDNLQYANHHAVIEVIGNSFTTKIYEGETLVSTNEVNTTKLPGLTFPDEGKIVFSVANCANNTFDNIKIYDLSATAEPSVIISPADSTKDVSVLSDVVLTYADEVSEDVVNAITVSPEADFEPVVDGNTVTLKFTDALAYETEYTVASGSTTSTFKTQAGINVLYYEDFSDASAALAKLENYGPMNGHSYGVRASEALGFNLASGNSLTSNRASKLNVDAPRAAIKGSENWTDYRIEYKMAVGNVSPHANLLVRMNEANGTYTGATVAWGYDNAKSTEPYVTVQPVVNSNGNSWSCYKSGTISGSDVGAAGATIPCVDTDGRYMQADITVQGQDISGTITDSVYDVMWTIDKNEDYIGSAFSMPDSGKIVFGGNTTEVLFDDIKVTDLGFRFEPEDIKDVPGKVSLVFTENVLPSSVSASDFTVTDANGDAIEVVPMVTDNQIDLLLVGEEDGLYNVKVSKDITNEAGKAMSADKSFDITVIASDDVIDTPISISPAAGSTDVSVFTDVEVMYVMDVTEDIASALSVSVSPETEYTKVISENTVRICFTDALSYGTTYTVTAGELSTSFTTEDEEEAVIFYENFDNATTAFARFEQYGPALEGYPIVVDNYSQDSNVLHYDDLNGNWSKLPDANKNIYDFTVAAPRAVIKDLLLRDFKLEFDYSTGPGHLSNVFLRMNNDANGYHGLQIDLGAQTGARPDGTTVDGAILNGYNPITNSVKAAGGIYADSIDRGWYDLGGNSYGLVYHCEITLKGTTLTSKIYCKDELLNTNVVENLPYTNAGSIVFASNYVPNTFDNIKITDLGMSFEADKTKNVQEVISLTFDEALANTNKWDELITVTDADGNAAKFSAAVNIKTGKQLNITLADPKDGEYTITVKKGVEANSGATTQMDKSVTVLVTMPYNITDFAIGNLVAGNKVTAEAKLSHSVTTPQDYTIVLAIYDDEGRLYDVAYDTVTLSVPAAKKDFSVTSDLALPSDITGYTAGAWFIDNLTNIKPMSGKITK